MPLRRYIMVFWMVALLLTNGACAFFNRQPESRFNAGQLQELGEKFLAAGSLGQALKYLTEAESQEPNNPVIQYDLAQGYEERGMDTPALEHYLKAVKLKPDYADAHNALGAFYARRGNMENAEAHFKKALYNPFYETPHMAYYNLGLLYEKRGETQRALEQYQEAIRLNGSYGMAFYHIGLMLENLRRADAAKEAYGKAIQNSPDLVEAHFRYGVMSYTAGEMENAILSLSRVIKLAPHTTMATEARKYLERLQGAMGSSNSNSSKLPPSDRISHLEVISDQDLQRQSTRPVSSPPAKSRPDEPSAFLAEQKAAPAPPTEPQPQMEASAPLPPGTQWTYIVQVSSFLNKENAEALGQKLKAKGYKVAVKPLQHQVLGQVYIVQLSPVSEESKANTLMAQVESDELVKPIIIKVPASY